MEFKTTFLGSVKPILWYLLKILVLSYGIMTLIEVIADNGLKQSKGTIFNDWENLLQGNIDSDLIILGSSRGTVGYDPIKIGSELGLTSYNLSFNGGPQNLQYTKLDLYLRNNKIPNVIIQNVDINHFGTLKAIPDPVQLIPVMGNSALREKFSAIDPVFSKYSFIPLLKYNQRMSLLMKGLLSSLGFQFSLFPTQKGFTPISKAFIPDESNLIRIRTDGETNNDFKDYQKDFEMTFSYLSTKIPSSTCIFFIWAPEYKIRLQTYPELMQKVRNEIICRSSEMPNAFFLDFSEDSISEDSRYFYDTFHLNSEGSSIFSKKLSGKMKQYLPNHAL